LLAFFDDAGTDAHGSTLHEQTINFQRDLAEIERELFKHHALLGRHQGKIKPRQRNAWIEAHHKPTSIKDQCASVLEESQRSTQNPEQSGGQVRKSKRGSQLRRSQIGRKSRGSVPDDHGIKTTHDRSSKAQLSVQGNSMEARQSSMQLLHPEQQQQQKQQRQSQQEQKRDITGKVSIPRHSAAVRRSAEISTPHRMSGSISFDQRPSMLNITWAQLLMISGLPGGRSAHYVAKAGFEGQEWFQSTDEKKKETAEDTCIVKEQIQLTGGEGARWVIITVSKTRPDVMDVGSCRVDVFDERNHGMHDHELFNDRGEPSGASFRLKLHVPEGLMPVSEPAVPKRPSEIQKRSMAVTQDPHGAGQSSRESQIRKSNLKRPSRNSQLSQVMVHEPPSEPSPVPAPDPSSASSDHDPSSDDDFAEEGGESESEISESEESESDADQVDSSEDDTGSQ